MFYGNQLEECIDLDEREQCSPIHPQYNTNHRKPTPKPLLQFVIITRKLAVVTNQQLAAEVRLFPVVVPVLSLVGEDSVLTYNMRLVEVE
eukprot:2758822-Pyramimonas_sp.AAC.1